MGLCGSRAPYGAGPYGARNFGHGYEHQEMGVLPQQMVVEEPLDVYEPDHKFVYESGYLPLSLPETIYSALLSAMLNGMSWQLKSLTVWVGIAVSFQVICTYHLTDFISFSSESCEKGHIDLQIVCVCLFSASMLQKVREQVDTVRYMWRIGADNKSFARATGGYPPEVNGLLMQTETLGQNPGQTPYPYTHCITQIQPLVYLVFVVLFVYQISIAATIFILGAPYILQAEGSENTILNALALAFIMEIDSTLYQFAIDTHTKGRLLGKMETSIRFDQFMSPWCYIRCDKVIEYRPIFSAFLMGLTTWAMWYFVCRHSAKASA